MMGLLTLLLLIALIGLIPAAIAQKKGRSFVGWWLFGSALFIVALPAALLVGHNHTVMQKCPECRNWNVRDATRCRHCGSVLGRARPIQAANQPIPNVMKECPRCAEMVQVRAAVCRFCGHEFAGSSATNTATPLDDTARSRRLSDWSEAGKHPTDRFLEEKR